MKRPKGKGSVYERGTPEFDAKVLATSFNKRDPGQRPKLLIEANDIVDVINAVKRAKRENLKVSIVSGGHSWSQNHLREDCLLLSMARFNSINVDAERHRAIVGPGCWGIDLDRALKKHDLFFPVAHVPDVCMGGFLLQGGFGWGSTFLGNACESIVGIDVILADGSLIHASEEENSDLFWSARGSGPGFFGIVVRYHLKVHPRPKFQGMQLQVFKMKHMEEIYAWADRIGAEVPSSVEFQFVMTPKAMGIFSPGIEVFAPVLTNSYKEAREAVSFITKGPLRKKAAFTPPLIPVSTAHMGIVANITHFPATAKWCTDNMWSNAPVEDLMPGLKRIAETMPPAPSHALWLNWPSRAGKRPDMALNLDAKRYIAVYGEWFDSADDAKYANWATERMSDLAHLSEGVQLADENLGRRPARFTTDNNMARLDKARAKYDPDGLFNSWAGRFTPPKTNIPKAAIKPNAKIAKVAEN